MSARRAVDHARSHPGDGEPRRDGEDTYPMPLLEFQSTADPWMAPRVLVHAGLLWRFLVKAKKLPLSGKLPPILPVVLYNGDAHWQAPETLHDLVGLAAASPLWRWQPDVRYHLIDEGAFEVADLAARDGLPALLFRLESSPGPAEVVAVADALLAWLGRHPGFSGARSVFVELLGALMAPLGPDTRVPEDLLEVRNMLATRAERWKQDWRLEGLQEGRLEGRQEGRLEGRQEGELIGRRTGEAGLLLRQLERRFGPLPAGVRDRVLAANTATLEEWGVRVLDAGSLADVLA